MAKILKKKAPEQVKRLKKLPTKAGNTKTTRTVTYRHEQPSPATEHKPLCRGWVELKLIHQLAKGEKNKKELAREYGVSSQAITDFSRRHASRIQEVKDDISNEMVGLWVSHKKYRIAEYQKDLDRIEASIDAIEESGGIVPPVMMKLKHKCLAAIAEELGQLPTRLAQSIASEKITYIIPGVDLEKLK